MFLAREYERTDRVLGDGDSLLLVVYPMCPFWRAPERWSTPATTIMARRFGLLFSLLVAGRGAAGWGP